MKNPFRINVRWKLGKRIFRRYLAEKISRRMFLNYLGLGVLPIIIVSFVLFNLSQNALISYLNQRNLETARRASNEIYLFIKEPLTILNTLVQTRDILEMERFTQSRLINKIKNENPIFRKLFILDQTGLVVVTTSFGEELKDYSKHNAYRVAISGQIFFSEVTFSPSRFPLMLVAVPVRKYNMVEGVLVGEIDLKNIWNLVDDITVDSTGNAFLLSSDGSIIAHPDKQKVLQKESFALYPFFKEILKGREGTTQFVSEGKEMIAAFAPISISDLRWGIVIQQTKAEAYELASKMRERVIFFVVLTTLLAIFLAVASVKRIANPIDILVRDVREYARGNLSHRTRLKRRDELGELAHEFNAMAESLDKNQKKLARMERLAALSQFASLVSHEIRNPLNAMNINVQILRRLMIQENTPVDKKIKYLNIISSEIDRMNSLVTNFLTITRPPELTLIRTNIHQILEEVIILQEAQARKKQIRIHRKYAEENCLGMFDHNQLKQVFHNIIINAFDAMPNGGDLWITTYVHDDLKQENQESRYVVIKIQDSGCGIPSDKLQEIFDFYYTTKKTGTGLGLPIAKQIVEGHNGSIVIESETGKGTTVVIKLPVKD